MAAPDRRAGWSRSRWAVIVGAILVAGIAVAVISLMRTRGERAPVAAVALPAPHDTSAPSAPSPTEFAGAESCGSCHASQVAAWRGSTHGTAGGVPGVVRVLAPFTGAPIRFRDAVVIPAASGGRYTFTVRQDSLPPQTFTVDGVVGGGHMEGGGTQGFLSKWPDGTWRFLPFDWSRHSATWFCNTATRLDSGWVPIRPTMALADCGDWPPKRVFGDEPRFTNCQGCHGSRVALTFDSAAHRWNTRVATLAIDCEMCHGPAKRHVDRMRAGDSTNVDIGIASLATLSKDQSLDVCFQCHALKDRVAPGYRPGASLAEFYALRLPQLGGAALDPDGRTRTFAYQEGHLASDCYVNGGMTCTSCHDPHSQRYRDVNGAALPGRFDDRQCTSCHASLREQPTAHTHHAAGSAGSRCTSCHMPYRQELEIGSAIRYARSDHTIGIPRPLLDGIRQPSACRSCHADRTEAALDSTVRRWWGTIKPRDVAVDGAARIAEATDRVQAASLALHPSSRNTTAVYAGLARFIERWLTPDMPSLEPSIVARLDSLAVHPDLDVRATALAALHFARASDAGVGRVLVRALDSAGASERALRARWGLVLGFLADRARESNDEAAAIATYRKAIAIVPRDPRVRLNLGLALAALGDHAGAIASYRESLALDPRQPLAFVNLGIALETQSPSGAAEAERAYRDATTVDPTEPLGWFNLGNARFRRGDTAGAIAAYTRATALDPSLAPAEFYLADAYARTGALREALAAVRRGLAFDPSNTAARAAEARLVQAISR